MRLFRSLVPDSKALLATAAPAGVQAVPRTDASLFIVNTSSKTAPIKLSRPATDRLSGRSVQADVVLKGYEVLWLE